MEETQKTWLITGITGQDGSLFADYLLKLGYTNIHGILRRSSTLNTSNIDHVFDKLKLHHGDLTDSMNIHSIISKVKPDYIMNFAAQSHVKVSHNIESYTMMTNTMGILYILQSVRELELKNCKIYHASTSEMYGNETNGETMLTETSPMNPVSIYGISKLAAQNICNMYRDAFGMFIVSSVLFNHEGPRRGKTFVTRKIVDHVIRYKDNDKIKPLRLGNLNAKRDWGDAEDYMKAVYQMMMQSKPSNYVIASGETHSVREFAEEAFNSVGINIEWVGTGVNEKGINKSTKEVLVVVDPLYYREIDIDCLIGDASKALKELGWKPQVTFKELVSKMINKCKN
jgi:GDPmannose 4,6-dehydratase